MRFFYVQRSYKMAKFFEIGREMANLATLASVSPGTQQTTSSMYTEGALSCHTSNRLILTNLALSINRLRWGNGITLRQRDYIDRLGVMAQKAEKMLQKMINE